MKTSSYGKYIHSQIRKEVKAEMKAEVKAKMEAKMAEKDKVTTVMHAVPWIFSG